MVTVLNNNIESCRHVSLTMQSVLGAPSAMRPSGLNSNGASGQPPKKNLSDPNFNLSPSLCSD